MKNKLFILIALCISIHVLAQEPKKEIPLKYGATNIGKRQDEAMKRFRRIHSLGTVCHSWWRMER